MKQKIIYIVATLMVLIIICGAGIIVFDNNETENVSNQGDIQYSNEQYEQDKKIEEEIFPKDKISSIYITIKDSDFKDMLQNASKEEFEIADIDYNGHKLNNVAIRPKGNSSLMQVASSESDRYSFKIDFDEYTDGQNLYGITSINLNNNFSDPSYMREYLSYEMFEEMGVPTPRFSYINVYINDKLWGFYLAVEQINETFIKSNFEYTKGNLYKPEGDGSDLVYKSDKANDYSGLILKTNTTTKNHKAIIKLMKALSDGKDIEDYLDVDETLKYFAVSSVLSNFDSYQGSFKHNYYIYEQEGIFSIIPWDLNMSFAGFNMGMSNQQMIEVLIDEPTMGSLNERPLIGTLLENPEYKERYHSYIRQIVDGYLSKDTFDKRVGEIRELITSHVENDPSSFYSFDEYKSALNEETASNMNNKVLGLISFVNARVDNVKKQLDGTIPAYKDGSGLGVASMGMPGGQMPKNFDPEEMKKMIEEGNIPEELKSMFPDGKIPENFPAMNGNRPEGVQGGKLGGGMMPKGGNELMMMGNAQIAIDIMDMTIIVGGFLLLILATIFVFRFGKKKL